MIIKTKHVKNTGQMVRRGQIGKLGEKWAKNCTGGALTRSPFAPKIKSAPVSPTFVPGATLSLGTAYAPSWSRSRSSTAASGALRGVTC